MKKLFVVVIALSLSAAAFAQGKGNAKQIANGKFLFEDWGCTACHGIGPSYGAKDEAQGPNLAGLYKRRTEAWVMKFTKNPAAMIESGDKDAVEMSKKYSKTMKTFKMPDSEWNDIFAFIKSKQ